VAFDAGEVDMDTPILSSARSRISWIEQATCTEGTSKLRPSSPDHGLEFAIAAAWVRNASRIATERITRWKLPERAQAWLVPAQPPAQVWAQAVSWLPPTRATARWWVAVRAMEELPPW